MTAGNDNKNRIALKEGGLRVLNAARTELYIDMRFMGASLGYLSYEMDLTTTSIGTDAVSIRFNPTYILRLFVEEPSKLNRTYVHMLLHCIFRHMYTSESYEDTRLYDLCADIVVESVLDSMDYQSIYHISSDFRDRWYALLEKELKVLTVEKLYRFLGDSQNILDDTEYEKLEREFRMDDHGFWLRLEDKKTDEDHQQKEEGKKDKPPVDDVSGPGRNGQKDSRERYINPRRLKQISGSEKDWDKEAKRLQTEIETIGKNASDRLGKLEWMLQLSNTERRDYKDFLRRFMIIREESGIDMDSFDYGMYSFGLDYYGNMPLIEENEFREVKKVQEMVIAIDTSASCKDVLVQRFLNETAGILLGRDNFFQKIKIYILECDDRVQRTEVITSVDDMKKYSSGIHVEGGYGTDYRPVFERVEELRKAKAFDNLKGLMYFTDGYGKYPEKPTEYDTAFVFVKDEDYEDKDVPEWAFNLYI